MSEWAEGTTEHYGLQLVVERRADRALWNLTAGSIMPILAKPAETEPEASFAAGLAAILAALNV